MKIIIEDDGDEMILNNATLDNPNYVTVTLWDEDGNEVNMDVPVKDLMAAIIPFETMRHEYKQDIKD